MPVKLSAIKGLMIEKKDKTLCIHCGGDVGLHQHETELCPKNGKESIYPKKQEWQNCKYQNNWHIQNQVLDLQGSKQIGLNRERLATLFYNRKIKDYQVPNDEDILECTADAYRDADVIIREEATLLEVKVNV